MARRRVYAALALLLANLLVYGPTVRHEFVNFDDNHYVTENRHVLNGLTLEGLRWSWTSLEYSNWHPLTWLSHMLDVQLFGASPGGHHLVSVVLHATSALLLLHLLWGMTGAFWRPVIAASLFALHPLRVESVAWVAERKDVLATLLLLCAIAAYRSYARRPGWRTFVPVLLIFALGLTAKPMLVTFPFVLLLLDFWPLGRYEGGPPPAVDAGGARFPVRRLVLEKFPFFLLSLGSSVITYIAQKSGGAVSLEGNLFLGNRIGQAMVSYLGYLGKTAWPTGLAVFYPRGSSVNPLEVAAAVAVLAAISLVALRWARELPYLPVGWFWFAGTFVPVIGFVQVGSQAMADRYTYIPHIGLFVALVWLLGEVPRRWPGARTALAGVAAASVGSFALLAALQVTRWRDTEILMQSALAIEGGNWLAEVNVGEILVRKGRHEEATTHFRNAVRLNAMSSLARYNLATSLSREGRYAEALEHFQAALEMQPASTLTLNNLALALSALGRHEEAVARMESALRLSPQDAKGYYNLGLVLDAAGRLGDAERAYRRALELDEAMVAGHNNLGIVLARQGRMSEAIGHFSAAVRLDPADSAAKDNLARALGRRP